MRSGVTLLLIAMSLTPGVDGLAKVLTDSASPFMVTFLRFFSAGMVGLIVALATGVKLSLPIRAWPGQIGRTSLLVGAIACLVYALNVVPLAYAAGGFLISPIVSTLLGAVFLNEALTPNRIFGASLAFVGALIIVEPTASIHFGTLIALFGGCLLGGFLVATRASAATALHPMATLAIQCLLAAAMISPLAFQAGPPQLAASDCLWVAALGLLAATTHVLTVAAYERSEAGKLAPFMYFNLVAAIFVGYFLFGELPEFGAFIGLCAIGLGGVLTVIPPEKFPILHKNRSLISA